MAVLYVTEYASQAQDAGNRLAPMPAEPSVAEQSLAIGATSVQSNAFNAGTRLIRVCTDAACSIAIGPNPTAVATAKRLPANTVEYFGVTKGHKIAVITNT